jgi:hypothetical protein
MVKNRAAIFLIYINQKFFIQNISCKNIILSFELETPKIIITISIK